MKTRDIAVVGLVVLLVLGFWYLANPSSYQAQIARDVVRDKMRFSPQNSLDIAMAMGLVTHDPPQMLAPPEPGPPTLLYPPSESDLARLSGPQTSPL